MNSVNSGVSGVNSGVFCSVCVGVNVIVNIEVKQCFSWGGLCLILGE